MFCFQKRCFDFLVKSHWCVKQIFDNENDDGCGNGSGWEDVCLIGATKGFLMVTFNLWLQLATNLIFHFKKYLVMRTIVVAVEEKVFH